MVDAQTFRDELRRLKTLIQEDPAVRARYDTDGDGEISGPEWERAVLLLRQELGSRGASAQGAAPAVLQRVQAPPLVEAPSIPTCRELVLEQEVEHREVFVGYEQANRYRLLDGATGREIGGASENRGGFGGFLVRQLAGSARPLHVNITESEAGYWMEGERPFALFGALAPAELLVLSPNGALGTVKRQFPPLTHRSYRVTVAEKPAEPLRIEGRLWKPWTFPVLRRGRQVACIRKKWSGALREGFTDADTFRVTFDDASLGSSEKRLLVAAALAIDFDFFERGNS